MAKSPTKNYFMQRVSGAVMIPLSLWMLFYIIPNFGNLFSESNFVTGIAAIFGNIACVACLLMFFLSALYHGMLGMQSIIRDYIHCECMKKLMNIILIGGSFCVAVFMCLFLVEIHHSIEDASDDSTEEITSVTIQENY